MTRIEVEVRTVVRRLVVESDDRAAVLLPRSILMTQPPAPRPSRALPEGPRRRQLAVAGGSLLIAAGLALGQAAARGQFGRPALPRLPSVGRLRAPASRSVPALPSGGVDPAS